MFGEEELVRSHKPRANLLINIVVCAFAILVSRLWYLQIYKGKLLYKYSLQNRLRREEVKAPRGMIFSRNNYMLVNNIPRFDAVLVPQYLKDRESTIKKLSTILDLKVSSIKKTLQKYSTLPKYKPIIIKKNISRKEVAIIETENNHIPGVSVETFISREYLDKEIGAHLLGYISEISSSQLKKLQEQTNFPYQQGDFIGKYGLEEKMDLILRGKDGHEFVEVDALGRKKRAINTDNFFKGIKNQPSIPGKNLRLTIDRDLQIAAYNALEGKVGGAVALDVQTGEVLAMVSRPGFDPSLFSKGLTSTYWNSLINDKRKPLRNHTTQDHYPPGSTFKTFALLAGLEEGLIKEDTEVNCRGAFRFGRRTFHCWRKYGHGKVGPEKAIRESCDVFFYKLATKMNIDTLAKYAFAFGLGERTQLDLPLEAPGLIPTTEWKKKAKGQDWIKGETLSCIIGQSYVLSTPIQLAIAYSALANGGKIFKPYLVKEIFSNNGEVTQKFEPTLLSESKFSQKSLDIVRRGLFEVANHPKGTAWYKRGLGIQMAGKTGTSQVLRFSSDKIFANCMDYDYEHRHHGLFVAYAPYKKPKIAVAGVVEHGCSSSKAVPVVESVISAYMKKYQPKLHEQMIEEDKKMYRKLREKQKKLAQSEQKESEE